MDSSAVKPLMNPARLVRVSKYLSKHLRHAPEAIGLTLGAGGWVEVETLLASAAAHGFTIAREELDEVVATSDKQRFAFDESGARIRANQGHSVEVDLELEASAPPERLFHGTAAHVEGVIMAGGLLKMKRHHVHLSADVETA